MYKFFDDNGNVLNEMSEDEDVKHILSLLKEMLICIIKEQQTV
jgi:hypothetical protein